MNINLHLKALIVGIGILALIGVGSVSLAWLGIRFPITLILVLLCAFAYCVGRAALS